MGRRAVVAGVLAAAAGWYAVAALALPPFTTAPKTLAGSGGTGQTEVYSLTVGCHPGFDRVVIRSRNGNPSAAVRYVPRVEGDPSGLPVPLLGAARLHVELHLARAHTAGGRSLLPGTLTPRCPNLRQVKVAGDFEGYVSFGLGLRHRAGFRIWQTRAPNRIVVDVAH
jgi:hypothetical protein